ncbi:MAG: TetR/AcrR family transcriptional regulator [Actinobacteria bacterium]|nr:TetR/AcrR family transcriptional regulator [Actinomycetota bacterium]
MVRGVGKTSSEAARPDADDAPVDGRAARAVRTRSAIVDALLDLVHEGDLQPTANRIAERAGISLRLIYHHYGDLESLFRAASAREAERLGAQVRPISDGLPLAERIDQFVAQRSQLLEWITPVRRASLLQEPFSEELRAARDALTEIGEQQVLDVFDPELSVLRAGQRSIVRAALANVLSWGLWNDLRTSGRSVEESARAVHLLASSLLVSSSS